MARQIVVITLIFFAIVGMAAAYSADSPAASPSAEGPAIFDDIDNDLIGTTDDDSAEAAPVGAPVPEGVFTVIDAPTPSPTGGAAALKVTSVAGAIAAAASFFF